MSLNTVHEIVSAKAFGNMGVGPKVYGVFLIKNIPPQLELDNKPDYNGCLLGDCWSLAIIMQRMAGSIRIAQHLPPGQRAFFWKRLNTGRVVQIVRTLSSLGYDHSDIRHDNIGYVIRNLPNSLPVVDLYLMDYGYGRVLKNVDANLPAKILNGICTALESVGAPKVVRQVLNDEYYSMQT